MRVRILASALALVLLPLLQGCGATQTSSNPFDSGGPGRVTLEVLNDNWQQVSLRVDTRAGQIYLGRVEGETQETFVFSLDVAQEIAIQVDVLAGGRCLTRRTTVDPGDVLELQIREIDCSR